jgi:hypothetical protein
MLDLLARLRSRKESRRNRPKAGRGDAAVTQRLAVVERRLEHLEAMIEGLQDSVHRQSVRQEKTIDQLQKKAEPSAIRRALGRHDREHGI